MNNRPAAFFMRKFALFSLPFWVLFLCYVYFDPFKVIYSYDDYNKDYVAIPNRDVMSTRVFLSNYKQYHYRSFILGNSRTLAFLTADWKQWINDPVPFKFDAASESIFGLWSKLKFLNAHCDSIDNVLIVCDGPLLRRTRDSKGPLFIKDYKVSGNSVFTFHWTFLKAWLTDLFFVKYIDYKVFHKFRFYMNGALDNRKIRFTPVTNDLLIQDQQEAVATNPEKYYAEHLSLFYKRDTVKHEGEAVLGEEEIAMLKEMKLIFDQHKTKYRFIISPLYDQISLNDADLDILIHIFGKGTVADFSGINQFTSDYHNYYEISHYRIEVGRALMKEIYSK